MQKSPARLKNYSTKARRDPGSNPYPWKIPCHAKVKAVKRYPVKKTTALSSAGILAEFTRPYCWASKKAMACRSSANR